jgi:polyisoprenoid-binding protein YceI
MKTLLVGLMMISSAFAAEIDVASSSLKWTGKKVTGEHFGKIAFSKGNLDIKDGKIMAGEFIVDMTSIGCDDLEGEWKDKLVGHLKNDDFFSVDKFKTSTLKIKSATQAKGDIFNVVADLTIKDKTHPVKFDMTKKDGKFAGKLVFDRTKYDIKYGSGKFFADLGDKMINDEVALDFTVAVKN